MATDDLAQQVATINALMVERTPDPAGRLADVLQAEKRAWVEEQAIAADERLDIGPRNQTQPAVPGLRAITEADFRQVTLLVCEAVLEEGGCTLTAWTEAINANLIGLAVRPLPVQVCAASFRDVFADYLRTALEARYGQATIVWADGQCSVQGYIPARRFFDLQAQFRQLRGLIRPLLDQARFYVEAELPGEPVRPMGAYTSSLNQTTDGPSSPFPGPVPPAGLGPPVPPPMGSEGGRPGYGPVGRIAGGPGVTPARGYFPDEEPTKESSR